MQVPKRTTGPCKKGHATITQLETRRELPPILCPSNNEEDCLPRIKNPHASPKYVGRGGADVQGKGMWMVFHWNLVGMVTLGSPGWTSPGVSGAKPRATGGPRTLHPFAARN